LPGLAHLWPEKIAGQTVGSSEVFQKHPVGRVCRDEDGIPRGHGNGPVPKLEFHCPFEDDHPFVLVLVVPKAIGGPVAHGDDPLDPDAVASLKNRGQFFGQLSRDVGEEVHGVIVLSAWMGGGGPGAAPAPHSQFTSCA